MASFFVKFKILLAYLSLILIGVLAVWVVLAQVDSLSAPDHTLENSGKRSSVVSEMLFYLYRSESDGMQLLMGNKDYLSRYEDDLNAIYVSLDSLKSFSADSVQVARLDSVASLIALKEATLLSMIGGADMDAYNKEINKRISRLLPDSAALDEQLLASTKNIVRRDTVITKHKSGNFFSRLKGVFKKSRKDSTVIVTSTGDSDSIYVSVADSINAVLGDLQADIAGLQSWAVARQRGLLSKWAEDNYSVNSLIYRIINDYEMDMAAAMLVSEAKKESEDGTTVKILAAIAIAAITVVLFFIWVIWRDLERSNRYKKELERINKANLELLSARENLMLAITHDIKAPLGSIIGYTDLLSRLSSGNREKLYISNIKASSDLLLSLVSDLLEFHKLDSGKEELKILPFNLCEFFDSVHRLFLPVAENKGLKLFLQVGVERGLCVESDPLKLRQVVNNLVNNAIKFTDKGSVGIYVSESAGILDVTVEDTGRGISDEDKLRLFSAFVRLGSAQGVQGFGLGLSIVDRIVKLMGGSIDVDSRINEGSRFMVHIPVAIVESGCNMVENKELLDAPSVNGCRILLVDDDELQMNLVCEICKSNGISADKCQFPAYAAKMVADGHYELVITDIQMPGMNGFDVLSAIKKVDGKIPVVAVTARAADENDYLQSGFSGVLTKPFRERDLLLMIGNLTGAVKVLDEQAEDVSGLAALVQFAGDDVAAKKEILQSFVVQTKENLQQLDKAFVDGDCDLLMALCHKMLPIFTLIKDKDIEFVLRKYEKGVTRDSMISTGEMKILKDRVGVIVEEAKKELI